jgi:large subunit GTPase 1
MTVAELRDKENEAFLAWRRGLASFEEKNYTITLTPYEKNIEVWKQLWRVVEKSDILVQVVDGRDILFFRCEDLELYVTETHPYQNNVLKLNFLLINKSDLLSEELRQAWSAYLNERGIKHVFFSAKWEQEK